MTESRFKDIDPLVETHFRFLDTNFGYEPLTSVGTSHARHAYLKMYRKALLSVSIILFDWDVQTKHWNVFFRDESTDSLQIDWRTERSIFTIAEVIGVDLVPHSRDAISSKDQTLGDILNDLSKFTRTHAIGVLNGDFSVFEKLEN